MNEQCLVRQQATDGFVGRLQQLNEFDCVPKAFVYLASHLSRDELLESVTGETMEQIVRTLQNMMSIIALNPKADCFLGRDVAVNDIEAACCRMSSKAAVVGASLFEAEPDIFPCIVVISGSAFAFLKVSTCRFCFSC